MKSLLKFITCGSVDDGKSTLIGHMLYDAKLLFADQEKALILGSKVGSAQGEIDYSLLLDGLMAEREQGITIDVAYRYFTSSVRSFVVADCPGHEQYTRNMTVGASFADLAVILVDASQGVLLQTRRHARICAMMGIRHFVIAVNKMDLIDYDPHRFDEIKRDVKALCAQFELTSIKVIPVCATKGDNITEQSENTAWYRGDSLLEYLENIDVETAVVNKGFTMPVQRVCRPNAQFRGFAGQIETGSVKVGGEILVLPNNETAKVSQIYVGDSKAKRARAGQPVTICLDREIDVSRGCVITSAKQPEVSDMVTADILWMDGEELLSGRNYIVKCGTMSIPATVMNIKYKIDVNTGQHKPADKLFKNEIASVDIAFSQKIVVDKFANNAALGGFIFMDRVSNATSACGVIVHTLRRSTNVVWHKTDITRAERSVQKAQTPLTLWFTGLSGSGKSTLANEVEKRLHLMGKHTMLLDGDNVRHGLNMNLGFKEEDRVENIRRIAQVCRLMNDAGLITLASFISPYEKDRENAKTIVGDAFVQIYVSTPLAECEKRDVKGLYAKARAGEIPNFTGISSPYEVPENPDVDIDTTGKSLEQAVQYVMDALKKYLER
ncbi:MAG: adenylyl-sulfate kinase [Clostridia bacterium]|jgi:bifunctional enzyme CysN/CysC|nr:adenylyl-sulfate kinase [Clostridia bacterium]MBT7123423.1 adenylyl-sulfate kinase [Clostridia bacterium]